MIIIFQLSFFFQLLSEPVQILCPENYEIVENQCFRYMYEKTDRRENQVKECIADGGWMAEPKDVKAAANYVKDKAKSLGITDPISMYFL